MKKMSICIYNLSSGSTNSLDMLKLLFKENSVQIDKWVPVKNLKKAVEQLSKGSIVYAVGGDGTLNAVASNIIDKDITMVPLPGGTFNHFIKDLGISATLSDAIRNISEYKSRRVDVGSVNDHYFLNNSSIGLYARTLNSREVLQQKYGKWPALVIANISELWSIRRYRAVIDGELHKTPLVFIGNNHYELTSHMIGNRESIDKGVLSVYITKIDTIPQLLKVAIKVIARRPLAQDEIEHTLQGSVTIDIKNRNEVFVSFDGEVAKLPTPLTFKIIPKALRILAPAESRSKNT